MELVETQRQALKEIRSLLKRFVAAEIEPADFIPRYGRLFAPFDPPDLTTDALSVSEQHELDLYIKLNGGWFGESKDEIPKNPAWKYGVDTAPYSWIDGPGYRRWICLRAEEAGVML